MSLSKLNSNVQNELIEAGIRAGILDAERVKQLELISRRQRMNLLDMVKYESRLPQQVLFQLWAESLGLPFTTLSEHTVHADSVAALSASMIWRRRAVPVRTNAGELWVACSNPLESTWLAHYNKTLEKFQIAVAEPQVIEHFLTTHVPIKKPGFPQDALEPMELLEDIFIECHLRRASDIHIESLTQGVRVRLRVDGKLQNYAAPFNPKLGAGLISRTKVLAGLDIAESRAPQDGGFTYAFQRAPLDSIEVRVASLPTHRGERVTIRILAAGSESLTLEQLGMPPRQKQRFERLIRQSNGMLLITGPTGSGKSTTLYGALRELNRDDINILTVEDPVESCIEGVNQVNANGKTSFSQALRSFLRHDPDVIMVGEIRDKDTANVALKASLTGHFVFSTLHTNTACGAITRLGDIGCDPFLIGATLKAVIAQRLVRRLCSHCKEAVHATESESGILGIEVGQLIYRARGCALCQNSGYRGRIGIFEFLWINDKLAEFISTGPSELAIAAHSGQDLITLRMDAAEKVTLGMVSMDDIEPLLGMTEISRET